MIQPFRFLQCGDLHLGTPFKYLKSLGKQVDEFANRATYRSFEAIVDLALQEQVQAVIITGDIYDSETHNLEAQVRFAHECERLSQGHIPVFMVQGNHDPAESWSAHIDLPENVHVFSAQSAERVPLVAHGRTLAYIYGISCSRQNREEAVAKSLVAQADDPFSIGLFHGTVGASEDHELVGPAKLNELIDSGMDYWAIGHIHKRQVLHEYPHVVYAGNIQGLHRKEQGPKGCYIVDVTGNGHIHLNFHETGAVRFEHEDIDISSLANQSEILEMIRHKKEMLRKLKRPVLVDFTLTGEGPLSALCQEEEVRQTWLMMSQEEERNKFAFIMPFRISNETKSLEDWQGRRAMGDMVSDYLKSYDLVSTLPKEACLVSLRRIINERPETKRLGRYNRLLTDELLWDALRRAESEGARCLIGDTDED